MADIDKFGSQLLEQAKRFLEKARTAPEPSAKVAFLHAAVLLGFSALEAQVNSIAADFLTLEDLPLHERSMLAEKRVEFEHGEFHLGNKLQIYRLDDRILFLCSRFRKGKTAIDRKAAYWSQFIAATDLRNGLTHPKAPSVVNEASVEQALTAIITLLDVIYRRVYGARYPAYLRGLQSTLSF